jgi:hypothetical protein
MDIESWLSAARADADRRGMPGLKPLLEALAVSTRVLRSGAGIEGQPAPPSGHARSDDDNRNDR